MHLTTLRKETRTCSCGKDFTAYIKVVDGKDALDGETTCQECRALVEEGEWKNELLTVLPLSQSNQLALWLQECNLPLLFRGKTFANFERKLQPKAYDTLKNYNRESRKSIVLLSPDLYGVGKTHLVAALINNTYLVAKDTASITQTKLLAFNEDGSYVNIKKYPCPVYFAVENTLLSRIRQTFSRSNKHDDDPFYEETEEDVYQKLAKYELLVIDDVGKVRPRDFSFLQSVYFRIIDDRYSNELPIILTTNLSFTELEAHIGGACADRLLEMAGKENFILMTGKSYRRKQLLPSTK